MADLKLKKFNGTTWEDAYPETTVDQIVATGTPSSSTFLRGDGAWSNLDAEPTRSHMYGKAQGTITKGQAVQFAGVDNGMLLIKPAVPSEINADPDYFVGLAESDLTNGQLGYFMTFGELENVNTSSYGLGDILWFASGGSTAGALTATEPTGTNAKIQVAAVKVVNATTGAAVVRVNRIGTPVEDINASGTPSSSTYLRGDGTWATVSAGGGDITAVTAGTGLTGGGTTGDVTVSHADTSTLSGTYGSTSDNTKIDTITVDEFGHITAIATGSTPAWALYLNGSSVDTISDGERVGFDEGTAMDITFDGSDLTFDVVPSAINTSALNNDAGWTSNTGTVSSLGDLGITATSTELNYVDGVTSSIQTQLNGKISEVTTSNGLTGGGTSSSVDISINTSGATNGEVLTYGNFGPYWSTLADSDNYDGWDLYTDGTSRGRISSGENVNFIGGTNVTLDYSTTNNAITINSSASGGGGTEWQLIKSGSTTVSGGTGATNLTLTDDISDTSVIAFELNTSSVYSTTSQVFVVKIENSNSIYSGILYNGYASSTSFRIGSVRVYRGINTTTLTFSYAYYSTNGSTSETADTIYIGRVWKLDGVVGT
jgi:hypothetical protein